jgi:hypothetical protein
VLILASGWARADGEPYFISSLRGSARVRAGETVSDGFLHFLQRLFGLGGDRPKQAQPAPPSKKNRPSTEAPARKASMSEDALRGAATMRCFGPSGQLLRFTPRTAARSSSGSSMNSRLLCLGSSSRCTRCSRRAARRSGRSRSAAACSGRKYHLPLAELTTV